MAKADKDLNLFDYLLVSINTNPLRFLSFLVIILFLSVKSTFAQIVDDTTTEVYGKHSTKYYLQEDVYYVNVSNRSLDSSLNNQHYYNYQFVNNTWYQGLGNMGMAMKPIYYKAPAEIGYKLGFESFHAYLNPLKDQRYYDTKSPYTELKFLQGSTGEQRLFVGLARNVNRYWNIGASYNRFTSAKQFAVVSKRDFQADHHQINAHTSFKTKNEKYVVLLNFNYMQHWSYESGGIKPVPELGGVIDSGMYLYKMADVRLFRSNVQAARNYYKTTNLHLYHQFNPLDSGNTRLQLFHEADWKRENQYFRDNNLQTDKAFRTYYGEVYFKDTLTANYLNKYELLQNKIGLKGNVANLFYALYYKTRTYSIVDISQDIATSGKPKMWMNDAFVGGELKYKLTKDIELGIAGQGLMAFKNIKHPDDSVYTSHDDYQLDATAKYKDFSLQIGQSRVSPTLMQSRLVYNLASYAHNKDSMTAVLNRNATFTYLKTKGERFLKLSVHYQRVDNLVYFKRLTSGADSSKLRSVQDKGYIDYVQPTIGFRVNYRTVYLENEFIFTNVFADNEIIHMPRWFTMPKLYYQRSLFDKAINLQVGAELFLKADYYADDYAPQLNQYFWQEKHVIKTFPITNAFLNFQISRATIFLKLTNVFGGQIEQRGYQETPYYAAMRRSFQFGVTWCAFD